MRLLSLLIVALSLAIGVNGFNNVSPLFRALQKQVITNGNNRFSLDNSVSLPVGGQLTSNADIEPSGGGYSCTVPSGATTLDFSGLQAITSAFPNAQYTVNGGAPQAIPSSGSVSLPLDASLGQNIVIGILLGSSTPAVTLTCNNPAFSSTEAPTSSAPTTVITSGPTTLTPVSTIPTTSSGPTSIAPTSSGVVISPIPTTEFESNALVIAGIPGESSNFACLLADNATSLEFDGLDIILRQYPNLEYEVNGQNPQTVPSSGDLSIPLSVDQGATVTVSFIPFASGVQTVQLTCNNPVYAANPPLLNTNSSVSSGPLIQTPYVTLSPLTFAAVYNSTTLLFSPYWGTYMNNTNLSLNIPVNVTNVYSRYPCAVDTHICFLFFNLTLSQWQLKTSLSENATLVAYSNFVNLTTYSLWYAFMNNAESNVIIGTSLIDICPGEWYSKSKSVLRVYNNNDTLVHVFELNTTLPYINGYQHFTENCTLLTSISSSSSVSATQQSSFCGLHIYAYTDPQFGNITWVYDNDTDFTNGYIAITQSSSLYSTYVNTNVTLWSLYNNDSFIQTNVVCDFCLANSVTVTNSSDIYDGVYSLESSISLNNHAIRNASCNSSSGLSAPTGLQNSGSIITTNSSNNNTCYLYSSGTSWLLDNDTDILNGFFAFKVADIWYEFNNSFIANNTNNNNIGSTGLLSPGSGGVNCLVDPCKNANCAYGCKANYATGCNFECLAPPSTNNVTVCPLVACSAEFITNACTNVECPTGQSCGADWCYRCQVRCSVDNSNNNNNNNNTNNNSSLGFNLFGGLESSVVILPLPALSPIYFNTSVTAECLA